MSFGGKCNLKFSKKRNQWENSPQSCTITLTNDDDIRGLNFYKGYSYSEVIFYYDEKFKSWIFNDYKFSVTTSSHQGELWSKLLLIASEKNIISCNAYSLNDGLKFDKLELSNSNLEIVKKYFPEKLEYFKNEIAEKLENERIERNERAKNRKLDRLDYTSKKGLLKALDKKKIELLNYRNELNLNNLVKLSNLEFSIDDFKNHTNVELKKAKIDIKNYYYLLENKKDFLQFCNLKEIDFKIYIYNKLENDFIKFLDSKKLLKKVIEHNNIELNDDLYISEAAKSIKEYLTIQGLKDII